MTEIGSAHQDAPRSNSSLIRRRSNRKITCNSATLHYTTKSYYILHGHDCIQLLERDLGCILIVVESCLHNKTRQILVPQFQVHQLHKPITKEEHTAYSSSPNLLLDWMLRVLCFLLDWILRVLCFLHHLLHKAVKTVTMINQTWFLHQKMSPKYNSENKIKTQSTRTVEQELEILRILYKP